METSLKSNMENEKNSAALNSVIAAIGLTTFKIIVGVLTGSLGILAEAAHSGLDLVAALVTFIAVKLSGRPPDEEHPYGHGKIENLSALFETLLLLATCAWIIYEAVQRLFFHPVEVELSIWAFIVMAASIVVDFTRSRMLFRTAKKYNSQALEADALHFSTDIYSSAVVILGLTLIWISTLFEGVTWLKNADAVAALVVALIVIYISFELGTRTVQALLDSAPKDIARQIKETVESIDGIMDCHHIRVRHSGPHLFVDVHILVDGNLPLSQAHALTEVVEEKIRAISNDADVTVHPEPQPE